MVNLSVHLGRERKIEAIVDVSEGRACVSLVSVTIGEPCEVLSSGYSALTLDSRTAEQEIASIGQSVAEAAQTAQRGYAAAGHHAPVTGAYVVVHAPWSHSEEARAKAHFDADTHVSDSLLTDLAKQALDSLPSADRASIIEASIIYSELNGYPVAEPEGKYASSAEMVSLISTCDPKVKEAVRSAVAAAFPAAKIEWRTALRAVLSLMRAKRRFQQAVFVDVGLNSTHIVSIRPGEISQRIVPEGLRTVLGKIAPGKPPEDTLTNLRMLAHDACSSEACEAVEKALVVAEPELARTFGEAIGQMGSERRVPNDLILAAHADIESWMSRFFSRIDFSQFTVTALPLSVHTADDLGISDFVQHDLPDQAIAIDAALVNIESRA